jgi:predicted Zn-ribbon and HTH transcriptional regulator
MDDQSANNNTSVNNNDFFDPMKDIDLSHIESQIIDTSKGNEVDFSTVAYNQIYSIKCLSCGFKYEGREVLDKCPRCGSDKIVDGQ